MKLGITLSIFHWSSELPFEVAPFLTIHVKKLRTKEADWLAQVYPVVSGRGNFTCGSV